MLKGIYLCAGHAMQKADNLIYQDLFIKRDIGGDCRNIDLYEYDYILCSPPCNYYSRANYRRNISKYALDTKDILPYMLNKLYKIGKPFIVENVRNEKLFVDLGLYDLPLFVYKIGRHTYWTNLLIPYDEMSSYYDGINLQHKCTVARQGDIQVKTMFQTFIDLIGG